MKKLYFVYNCDSFGEYQGVFDENHNLLDFWYDNDATWRSYFHPFMEKLGFECIESDDRKFKRTLRRACKDAWG